MKRIIVVEDNQAIADTLLYALRTEGYAPIWLSLGEEAVSIVREGKADLLILDVGLPDINGFEVCKQLRRFSDIPVIFLTARTDEVDRVVGLEIGADDYVVKPFSPREVVARVKTILRRRVPSGVRQALQTGAFVVDETRARIVFHGIALELTRYEYRLLKTLLGEPGRVFDRDTLMRAAWEHPDVSLERTVDTHIKQLRAKLKAVDPSFAPIRTHRGLGYSLAPDASG